MLDGSVGLILATTHGAGVILSFVPVVLYQGLLTYAAAGTHSFFTPDRLTQLTAVGGLLIVAIGINMDERGHFLEKGSAAREAGPFRLVVDPGHVPGADAGRVCLARASLIHGWVRRGMPCCDPN